MSDKCISAPPVAIIFFIEVKSFPFCKYATPFDVYISSLVPQCLFVAISMALAAITKSKFINSFSLDIIWGLFFKYSII